MKQLALLLMAASLTLPAQEAKAPAPARPAGANHIQRVYQVQHADVDELFRLVYTNAGNNQPTPVLRSSAALRAITVYGTPSEVDTIMASLKALDVPGRAAPIAGRNTFELTCYILLAAPEGEVEGSPLPDVLKGLATELERTFGLSQIRMIEAAVLRVGPRAANDLVGSLGPIGTYHFSVREAFREGTLARLGSVSLRLDMVGKKQINIISSADMEPGKLVVVGKAAVAGSKLSVIQVLSARMD
ncbi:MAG: hypothetical protein M9913_23475 [Bryobacteraceae bacterium]|nr:hypothetical protein [Solibacteraceae bacterium]MCO5353800.1 hypothetical protein [Bryobacteraceae bacterium]